ncbi:MAG TPA: hypothetical protein VF796_22635 [Humisphaera sp.]
MKATKSAPQSKEKPTPAPEVVVLGDHPSAYLAALMLHSGDKAGRGAVRVLHATIPDQSEPDRLVVINPAFFSLHPALEVLRRRLEMTTLYGLQFVSDDPAVRSEHRSKSGLGYVASSKAVRAELCRLVTDAGVETHVAKHFDLHRVDERGLDFTVNKHRRTAQALVLAGRLPEGQSRMLALPTSWEPGVMHRYTFLKLAGGKKWADLGQRPVAPMSLNLRDTLCWGWLLPGPKHCQLSVSQPVEQAQKLPPGELLAHWARVLRAGGVLLRDDVPLAEAQHLDLPLAGALTAEGVANRTLLLGPAGGFYCQSGEDIYPNCWSAQYACEAIKKALKEPHLQDALGPYRSRWRTTLGQYLRGPQQDFRFLLPLIYRNEVMTCRLTESILQGKSVVR